MRASSCPQLSIRTRLMSNIADRAATRSCAVAGCRVHAAPSHKVRPADTDTRSSAPRASPAAHELARCARRSANEKEATARPRLLFGFARIRACRKRQWCMNSASNRMIGSGIPISHSSNPRPKPMAFSSAIVDQATNVSETRRFHRRLKSAFNLDSTPRSTTSTSGLIGGRFQLEARDRRVAPCHHDLVALLASRRSAVARGRPPNHLIGRAAMRTGEILGRVAARDLNHRFNMS
jgi:hypothetical protein